MGGYVITNLNLKLNISLQYNNLYEDNKVNIRASNTLKILTFRHAQFEI